MCPTSSAPPSPGRTPSPTRGSGSPGAPTPSWRSWSGRSMPIPAAPTAPCWAPPGAAPRAPRLRALVGRRGVEEALRQLQRDGVYVTIQEFKGLREVRRGNRVFRFSEQSFRNPLIRAGLRAPSGGTRGPALWNTIPPENHRMGAEHLALALEAYGLRGAPVALWLAPAPGARAWAGLALAVIGQGPPPRFYHVGPRPPLRHRVFVRLLRQTARLRGVTLPGTTYVPLGDEAQILEWVAGAGPRGILTTPSLALRL